MGLTLIDAPQSINVRTDSLARSLTQVKIVPTKIKLKFFERRRKNKNPKATSGWHEQQVTANSTNGIRSNLLNLYVYTFGA